MTLWPPVESVWQEIEKEVSKEFEILKADTYSFQKDSGHWINFIVELYRLCYEPSDHCRHPDIKKMVQKAEYMGQYSKNIRLLKIKIEDPKFHQIKNGNPYGLNEVKNIKNFIREKCPQIPRFSVIHSFDTPARNEEVISLFKTHCEES